MNFCIFKGCVTLVINQIKLYCHLSQFHCSSTGQLVSYLFISKTKHLKIKIFEGCGYLLTGYLSKKSFKVQANAYINSLGAFLLIYNCLNALLLLSMFYQFGNRENWLHAADSTVNQTQAKAPLWLYILHPFLELLLGVLSSIWACIPKMRTICRRDLSLIQKHLSVLVIILFIIQLNLIR